MKQILLLTIMLSLVPSYVNAQSRTDFIKAKNLARQTAEKENGGLAHYRSVASMYNNDDTSACQLEVNPNYDALFVCEVFGGSPAAVIKPAIRTIVELKVIGRDWIVSIVSNEIIPQTTDIISDPEMLREEIKNLTAEVEGIISALEDYERQNGGNILLDKLKDFLDTLSASNVNEKTNIVNNKYPEP